MSKELVELNDGQMADAYVIDGLHRVLKKHGIDQSEMEEAIDGMSRR